MKAIILALTFGQYIGLGGMPLPVESSDRVHATVYHATVEQCNSDPEHTAFNFKLDLDNPWKHRIIAVSRDLLKKYPKGTKVRLTGVGNYNGIYVVMDKMNKKWTKRIDILINEGMPLISTSSAKIIKIN